MIVRFRLCQRHALKVKRRGALDFAAGYNVLVGPNGSGKTTVLAALHDCRRCDREVDGPAATTYFNAETMNPHNAAGPTGDRRNQLLRSRGIFSSHGQIMQDVMTSLPVTDGTVLLVDEPEAGQDLTGIRQLRGGFRAVCEAGGQVIAASHHPLLLGGAHLVELVPGYAERVLRTFRGELCDRF